MARHRRCSPTRRRAARSARRAACRASRYGAGARQGGAQARHRQVEIHKINAPGRQGAVRRRPPRAASSSYVTSAFVKEALDKGAELFNWEEKKARSGKRVGIEGARRRASRSAPTPAGSIGFDGLLIIRPDGKVQFQSGIGNLGTHAVIDVHRVAAEILGVPWEQCEVVWGDTSKHLPWTCVVRRQPDDARDDARGARRRHRRVKKLLQEIAAKTLGGSPGELPGGQRPRVRRRPQHDVRAGGAEGDRARRQVRRPRAAGGHQRLHEDVDDGAGRPGPDRGGARQLSARRPVAVLRRRLRGSRSGRRDRRSSTILDFTAVADVGTVHQPAQPAGPDLRRHRCSASATPSARSGSTTSTTACRWPSGSTTTSRRRFSTRRATFTFAAVDIPDPETPVGARGIGEPPVGAGCGAVLNAIAAAVGDDVFRRMPVTADMILTALEAGRPTHEPLTANI